VQLAAINISHKRTGLKFEYANDNGHLPKNPLGLIVSGLCFSPHNVFSIALFTVNFSHLHYNVFEHGCEAISGRNCTIARNCLTSTFKYIVMQMRKVNCEKGYWVYTQHPYSSAQYGQLPCNGYRWDQELVSVREKVRDSGSCFQLSLLHLLCVTEKRGMSITVRCPQGES